MIVAGGAGTRLSPLTDDTVKPLLPLVGMPFLEGLIEGLARFGVGKVLVVAGARTRPFEDLRSAARSVAIDLDVVPEPEPLDTAGGVRSALDRVDGPFLVLNGDVLMDLDVDALFAHHHDASAVATIALTRVEDPSSFGVCVLDEGRIVDFVEKPIPGSLPGQDTVNAGAYILEPTALASYPPGPLSFERQVFPELVASGQRVVGWVNDGVWADLGTPRRYLDGHRLVLDGAVPWPTVRRHVEVVGVPEADQMNVHPSAKLDPHTKLRPPVWIGPDVVIGAQTVVGPYAVVGRGARIGARAQLVDVVIHEEALVGADTKVYSAVLGRGVVVGIGTQIGRDGTVASEPVVVGSASRVQDHHVVAPGTRLRAQEA